MGSAAGQVRLDVLCVDECEPIHGDVATFDDEPVGSLPRCSPSAIAFVPTLEADPHGVQRRVDLAGWRDIGRYECAR